MHRPKKDGFGTAALQVVFHRELLMGIALQQLHRPWCFRRMCLQSGTNRQIESEFAYFRCSKFKPTGNLPGSIWPVNSWFDLCIQIIANPSKLMFVSQINIYTIRIYVYIFIYIHIIYNLNLYIQSVSWSHFALGQIKPPSWHSKVGPLRWSLAPCWLLFLVPTSGTSGWRKDVMYVNQK